VEAVASDAVLHGQLVGDGVAMRKLGHRRVEGRVEDSHHGHIGAERGSGCPHAREARGVVQRRNVASLFPKVQPSPASLVTLVLMIALSWVLGYAWAWLYNMFAKTV
jgi:hypothetical protein